MKRCGLILTVILTLAFGTAFAHQDFWTFADYGQVKVRVKTGFDYEEINKAYMIGQLAQKLAIALNHKDPIFLDFNHLYVGDCHPTYFVSYDKGKIEYTYESVSKEKNYLKSNSIVLRQVSRRFDVIATLRLLEYSIHNIAFIQKTQQEIEYNQNYCQWRIHTIDTNLIQAQLQIANSAVLNGILQSRVERPSPNFKYGVSYYMQDNRFHLFVRDYNKPDTTLAVVDHVYDFKELGGYSALIFDSDSSFYYLSLSKGPLVSKRQVIHHTYDHFRPFKVADIGGGKLSIYFSCYTDEEGPQPQRRTLIYLTEKDELIQDLDQLLEGR